MGKKTWEKGRFLLALNTYTHPHAKNARSTEILPKRNKGKTRKNDYFVKIFVYFVAWSAIVFVRFTPPSEINIPKRISSSSKENTHALNLWTFIYLLCTVRLPFQCFPLHFVLVALHLTHFIDSDLRARNKNAEKTAARNRWPLCNFVKIYFNIQREICPCAWCSVALRTRHCLQQRSEQERQ